MNKAKDLVSTCSKPGRCCSGFLSLPLAAMAEWLRRLTRNQMGSSRVASNPLAAVLKLESLNAHHSVHSVTKLEVPSCWFDAPWWTRTPIAPVAKQVLKLDLEWYSLWFESRLIQFHFFCFLYQISNTF